MDRTLKRAKRKNRRHIARNGRAWERFCPDGDTCRYCPHDITHHLMSSGQPHFFRKATPAEERDPFVLLYLHEPVSSSGQALPDGGSVLVRRMVVANPAELITVYCLACAEDIGTAQVLCYQRNLAVGEVIGIETGNRDIGMAA